MVLTTRQRDILDYIEACLRRDGLPPTRAEIVDHFGFASPNAAQCHLRALAARGAIELRAGTARGIIVRQLDPQPASDPETQPTLGVPLIGQVAAGTPILAIENHERELQVDAALFSPQPDYALTVRGDSMIGAGIADGDLLLVQRCAQANSGQIVVARIDDEVTVKRLVQTEHGVFLQPENPRHETLQITESMEFAIEGRAVGSIRPHIDGLTH